MSNEYTQLGSFESDRVNAVGVGDGTIAVAAGETVELIVGDTRVDIDHGSPIVDVDVADRIVVLSRGQLVTYSRSGERIWEQSVEQSHAVATVPDENLVGVLGPNSLRCLEIETGQERFRVDRVRRGGPADDSLLGTETGFVVATWTFLTGVTVDGEIEFDRNLEAVVRSVGRCGSVLVVALQSDQLIGIDAATGESRWRTELDGKHVAPAGERHALVSTGDGVRRVGPDGSTDPVRDLPRGDVYASTDESIVCTVREGTVSTYVHSREEVQLAVRSESVGVGGTIDVEVSNLSERRRKVDIEIDLDGATVSPPRRTVTVESGESELVDFPVDSVRTEGESEIDLAVDGASTASSTIRLEDAASGALSVEASVEPRTLRRGVAELEVLVENVGGVPVDEVRLFETDARSDGLDPGETWSETVTRPYQPERRVTVGLEGMRGDRRREYAPTCQLPPSPTIDLDTGGEALRTTISTPSSITVEDSLVIEMPGAGRTRTPVSIDRAELLLIVPRFEDGIARIAFEHLDVEERARISDSDPLTVPTSVDRTVSRDEHTSNEASSATADGSSKSPELQVSREIDTEGTPIGHSVRERVVLEAVDPVEPVTMVEENGDAGSAGGIDVGSLEAGERRTLSRKVALFSSTQVTLPSLRFERGGTELGRIAKLRLEGSERGLVPKIRVDPNDGSLVAALENAGDTRCRVRGFEVDGSVVDLDVDLGPEESATVSKSFDAPRVPKSRVIDGSLAVAVGDGPTTTVDVLAVAQTTGGEDTGESVIRADIGSETRVAGEYSVVVLTLQSEAPVTNVTVSASGDPINELFYTPVRRDRLEAEERIEHFIDLEPTGKRSTFEVELSYLVDGTQRERRYRLSGPAVSDENEWTEEHLDAWTIEGSDAEPGGSRPDLPSLVSTEYRIDPR